MLRKPEEIIHRGVKLSDALEAHKLWLRGDSDGERLIWDGASLDDASLNFASLNFASLNRASLDRASLDGASLDGASLNFASLNRVRGNMREIKSAHFDRWSIAWVTDPDGSVTLQIGCQRHSLDLWEKSDPRWIATLDVEAPNWWAKYREVVLSLVKASPATRYGRER